MLFATRDSAVAKKPRLRFSISRSSSVRPSRDFHSEMSACIDTSVGIQWLLQAARYFSHAQVYFSGSSWLTSARELIIALSATSTRAAPIERVLTGRPRTPGGPRRTPPQLVQAVSINAGQVQQRQQVRR